MRRGRGFTLVELLVVMGLVAVLMSLLLPAVQVARQRSLAAACQNNLREIGFALEVYRSAHDLRIPAILLGDARQLLHRQAGVGSSAFAHEPIGAASARFTDYCDPSVLACPATRGTAEISYGVNGRLLKAGKKYFLKSDPVELPLVFDAHKPVGLYYSDLDFRHLGDANVLFADYHVAPRYVNAVMHFERTTPLPGGSEPLAGSPGAPGEGSVPPSGGDEPAAPDDFTLDGGVVMARTRLDATITCLGGAFTGDEPIYGWYRLNGGSARWITHNARQGGDTVVLRGLTEGDVITVVGRVKNHAKFESDDGSGHCWSLRNGEPVPTLQGYLDQPDIADFVRNYCDPATGRVRIPDNAVIYHFELSDQINYRRYPWADFQDLVVLITFTRVPDTGTHQNNGHGNNADGVDISNPGQGQGGPTGSEDPSAPVDDETRGGGAAGSNDGGNQGGAAQVSAVFTHQNRRVTCTSTKELSNVVLNFVDGSHQKFDDLSGYTRSFRGTGLNRNKPIAGVWIKSGNNASGDGPGYGQYVDNPNL